MTPNEYLEAVLQDQTLAPGSDELEALQRRGREVKELLRSAFSEHSPSVRDAGSYEKGTMVRTSYDYDALCYFPHDTGVGDNLAEISDEVFRVLSEEYTVERKRSALRLHDATDHEDPEYFHVDVVPGRFMDGDDGDVALHQSGGEKDWLKTNPEEHIRHVKESGVRDAIKLAKVWREKSGFTIPTFVLELLVIKVLDGHQDEDLEDQMVHLWTVLRDRAENITVKDPANDNNDLSTVFDAAAKITLAHAAEAALNKAEADNWEGILGKVEAKTQEKVADALKGAAAGTSNPSRSYCGDER